MTIKEFQEWLEEAIKEGQFCGDDQIVVYNGFSGQECQVSEVYAEDGCVVIEV